MRISDMIKGTGQKLNKLISVAAEKAETLDVSLERRKTMREIVEEYNDVSSIVVNKLLDLDEETISKLPQDIQEAALKLKDLSESYNVLYEQGLEEKGVKLCVKCGKEVHATDAFCPWCGSKQE